MQAVKLSILSLTALSLMQACAPTPNSAEQADDLQRSDNRTLTERLFGRSTVESFSAYFQDPEPLNITAEQLQALPYAALFAETPQGAQALAILGYTDNVGYGADPLQQRLQWYAGTGVMDTLGGRIVRLEGGTGTVIEQHLASTEALDAVLCYRQAVAAQQAATNCPQTATLSYDLKLQGVNFSQLAPSYQWQREQSPVSYQLADAISSITLKNGYSYNVRILTETAHDGRFSNFFAIEISTGTVIESKQWLGDSFGSLYYAMAKPYFHQLDSETLAARQYPYQVANPQSSIIISHGSKQHRMSFDQLPRLDEVVNALPADGSGQFYAPLTRLHSCNLDQQFQAKLQGLRVKLQLLQQSYRADERDELAASVAQLEQQLQQWPLRATYIHGFSLAAARQNLQNNPRLNNEQACQQAGQASFELSLSSNGQGVTEVGLAANAAGAATDTLWVVTADGVQQHVGTASYNSSAASRALLNQANAIVFRGLKQSALPAGFTDLNQQIASFLAHWNYADAGK